MGEALARAVSAGYPRLQPEVLSTAASVANLSLISDGAAELGFTQADVLAGADSSSLGALARLHDNYLHVVVRAEDRLASLEDLRGCRVSLGAAGSGTEVQGGRLLAAAGLRPEAEVINVP